jgi:hypothetical protein
MSTPEIAELKRKCVHGELCMRCRYNFSGGKKRGDFWNDEIIQPYDTGTDVDQSFEPYNF